ncbi:MAG: TIM44-like domain-containing protein [Rubrivivax sp.]|nr:TIM44-like domain-containing protein [Rubrivivax sp.]
MLKRLAARFGRVLSRRAAAQALDTQAFLQVARQSFLQMQAAWDRADLPAIGQLASEPLLQELREQLAQRGPARNRTEVLELHARLLALEELHEAYIASIEFSGLIREEIDTTAAPFRELWMLAKIKPVVSGSAAVNSGRGWQLARVQSLS